MKKAAIFTVIFVLLLLIISCKPDPSDQYIYRSPESINHELTVGSLAEVNIDTKSIENAVTKIQTGKYGEVHSILIYKDGRLVLEEYFTGHEYKWDGPAYYGDLIEWDRSTPHCIHSDTKSITSICIGIAIDNGFIENVNQSIFEYLPEHQHLNKDGKDAITIEHLLTMTSGLDWEEWNIPYNSKDNPIIGIWFSDKDPITYILDKPLASAPGTSFTYYGGNMILLGEIIKNATKLNIDEFSSKYLFEPIGIESAYWWSKFENGVIEAAGGLKMVPRDMAKIGILFLNNGAWNDKQIVSGEWVQKSATAFPVNTGIKIPGEDTGRAGYSYSWWTKQYSDSGKKTNIFWALGWGGQKIIVIPEYNVVVVFTGGNYTSEVKTFTILEKYIIPAIH